MAASLKLFIKAEGCCKHCASPVSESGPERVYKASGRHFFRRISVHRTPQEVGSVFLAFRRRAIFERSEKNLRAGGQYGAGILSATLIIVS